MLKKIVINFALFLSFISFSLTSVHAETSQEPVTLFLVQHADAPKKEVDPKRNLSEKGWSDIRKVANFFAKQSPLVSEIRHSGVLRAEQTATVLAQKLNKKSALKKVDHLNWNSELEPLLKELNQTKDSLVLVGHLPHLGQLTASLLTGKPQGQPVHFQKGGIVCLQRNDGHWSVAWMLTPEILK